MIQTDTQTERVESPAEQHTSEQHTSEQLSQPTAEQRESDEPVVELSVGGVPTKLSLSQLQRVVQQYADLAQQAEDVRASRAQLDGLLERLQSDPSMIFDLAQSLGHDPDKLAKERLVRRLELEAMSPSERELLELKQKLKQVEEEKESLATQRQTDAFLEDIQREFESFYAQNHMAPSPELAAEIIQIQKDALLRGQPRPSVSEAYQVLQAQRTRVRQEVLASLSPDDIPPDLLRKIKDRLLQESRKFTQPPRPQRERVSPQKTLTINEFFDNLTFS